MRIVAPNHWQPYALILMVLCLGLYWRFTWDISFAAHYGEKLTSDIARYAGMTIAKGEVPNLSRFKVMGKVYKASSNRLIFRTHGLQCIILQSYREQDHRFTIKIGKPYLIKSEITIIGDGFMRTKIKNKRLPIWASIRQQGG